MKNLILAVVFGLMSLTTFAQSKSPELPLGVSKGLSITYNEHIQLVFVTKKKMLTLEDIETIKKYIAFNYRLYYAEAPSVVKKRTKWVMTFEKR